jgi:UDP-N-acetylmuramoyl-L-alanyl-D-glutamate--2,6-diaminopimelate ligase
MAAAAEKQADRIIVTDDNPRGEDAALIVDEIVAGISACADYQVEHDRASAIALAIAEAAEGDVVLIAGKGHEDYQLIAGQRLAFSDQAVALKILGEGRG